MLFNTLPTVERERETIREIERAGIRERRLRVL